MSDVRLVLSVPYGIITATSLGIEGLARHRSPGSGKHFKGRKVFVNLALKDEHPDFEYLDEGGWRDAKKDSINALEAVSSGKRTKTALSNNAFSCTPLEAYGGVYLVKTGGKVLELENGGVAHSFSQGICHEKLTPSQVAEAAGVTETVQRKVHLYLVMSPVQLILFSNLSPVEYAWYATHRPGKLFRQVMFTELQIEHCTFAAQGKFNSALNEITSHPEKKTKTILSGDSINKVPFRSWTGHGARQGTALYVADKSKTALWNFPEVIPVDWERARG